MRYSTLIEGVHIKHVQSTLCMFFCISIVIPHSHKYGMVSQRVPVAYSHQLIPISTVCINAGVLFVVIQNVAPKMTIHFAYSLPLRFNLKYYKYNRQSSNARTWYRLGVQQFPLTYSHMSNVLWFSECNWGGIRQQYGLSCCFWESGGLWCALTDDHCEQTSSHTQDTGMALPQSGTAGDGTAHQNGKTWNT